jgi:hypothetical protein
VTRCRFGSCSNIAAVQRRISLYVLLVAGGLLAADDPLKPVHQITENKIVVWRFFPRTPCSIYSSNPTCPRAQGVPSPIKGACTDVAVCNDLNAAELVPKGKKIITTHFFAAGDNRIRSAPPGPGWTECTATNGACSIGRCKWEGMRPGFGKFKNWSDNRDRTAAVVVDLAPAR